jgi:tetratricopeptide (TPR) repeat protein
MRLARLAAPTLCLFLSVTVGVVACAPRFRYTAPPTVSEAERKACDEFARQTIEKAVAAHKAATSASTHWDANEVGWVVLFIVALPVLVPAYVASLPFGSGKALTDPAHASFERQYERLMEACVGPTVVASRVGPRHPDVAVALVTLAIAYSQAGRINEAGDLYHRALTIQEEALGPEHPDVAVTLESYALWLSKAGRESEAMATGARAKAIRDKAAQRSGSEPSP